MRSATAVARANGARAREPEHAGRAGGDVQHERRRVRPAVDDRHGEEAAPEREHDRRAARERAVGDAAQLRRESFGRTPSGFRRSRVRTTSPCGRSWCARRAPSGSSGPTAAVAVEARPALEAAHHAQRLGAERPVRAMPSRRWSVRTSRPHCRARGARAEIAVEVRPRNLGRRLRLPPSPGALARVLPRRIARASSGRRPRPLEAARALVADDGGLRARPKRPSALPEKKSSRRELDLERAHVAPRPADLQGALAERAAATLARGEASAAWPSWPRRGRAAGTAHRPEGDPIWSVHVPFPWAYGVS